MVYPARAILAKSLTMPEPTLVNGIPQDWVPSSVSTAVAGFFVIFMWPQGAASATDVTYFRSIPTELVNYSFTDPFSYATAIIRFPQITQFDDLDTVGGGFLGTEDNPANVDIFFYEAVPGSDLLDPLTNTYSLTYGNDVSNRTKLWEGYIADRQLGASEDGTYLEVQCQGALYQLDGYKQKPFFPRRPYVLERLIFEHSYPYWEPGDQGHPFAKPSLRTKPVLTRFPAGWTKITPPRNAGDPIWTDPANIYTPVIPPNRLWTGFTTRNTGSWDNTLTGFFQDILSILYTTDDCGVTAGNQWALRCEENRQPVLEIRDRARTPDFEVWVTQTGVVLNVDQDFTKKENALYGEGQGVDGSVWRNAFFTGAWNRTDYEPLAAADNVYPAQPTSAEGFVANPSYDPNVMVRESKTQYPTGLGLAEGISSAEKRLETVSSAGWSGTMTIALDPSPSFLRWHIRAGQTVKVKGFNGSGTTGVNFHIAEASVDLAKGVVTCKVDTKYRDLLTLEEAIARSFDPMTPSKLLQVNRRTNVIEDILAPWDYNAGSGFIPKYARYGKNKREGITAHYDFFKDKDPGIKFPYTDYTTQDGNRPRDFAEVTTSPATAHRGPYVVIPTGGASKDRWAMVPVVLSQKGTIRRTELAVYDSNGNVLPAELMLAVFYDWTPVQADSWPHEGSNYDPYSRQGLWESYDANGIPTPDYAPDAALFIIGWGTYDERGGYSPGRYSQGYPKTGLLVDEATWSYDFLQEGNGDFKVAVDQNRKDRLESITAWVGIWVEDLGQEAYVLGRFYREEQGSQ